MARADYAGVLDRHVNESETVAGGLIRPELARWRPGACEGTAVVTEAMLHGNRWPALYGGLLFDLAYRIAMLGCLSVAESVVSVVPLTLDFHFLKAVRKTDFQRGDITVGWRAATVSAEVGALLTEISLTQGQALVGCASAWCLSKLETYAGRTIDEAMQSFLAETPRILVLPAHGADWEPGQVRGRCLTKPGSFPAIADTLVAKAMATVRGDGCPEGWQESYLVRTLSYSWVVPVDDGLASFVASVPQRGNQMALAVGTLSLDGKEVGRTTGTVVIKRSPV